MRSRFEPKDQLTADSIAGEIDYCNLLNRVLPRDIRVISWMPLITPEFSARFDCIERGYKYFFPRGNLDIDLMREASHQLVGAHDFRNFCKLDVAHGVVTYVRRINSIDINLVQKNESDDYDMFCLDIKGSGFLWHMIRSIMTMFFIIGDKRESSSILKELLDVEKNPGKPQYFLAHEIPLNLFFCNYREDVLGEDEVPKNTEMANKWVYSQTALRFVIVNLQEHWCLQSVKSTMIYEMLKSLSKEYKQQFPEEPPILRQPHGLSIDIKKTEYVPLLDRQTASTLEERIEHVNKKQKLNNDENDQDTACEKKLMKIDIDE